MTRHVERKSGKLKGGDNMGELGVYGRIILRWILL
jgi:hypothetical protein